MSAADRIFKNTLFLYLRMGTSIILSFFTTRILLEALGASDYGLYNVVAGALSLLGFLSASLSTATQRFISYAKGEGHEDKIRIIFNTSIFLHWCIAFLILILFVAAGFVFFNGVLNIPDGRLNAAIIVYCCLIFSTVFSVTIVPYDGVLNAHENMRFYSIVGIIDAFIKLLIAIAVLHSTFDRLLIYGFLMAIQAWGVRAATKYYCSKKYEECFNIDLRKYTSKIEIRRMMSFAGWNMLNICAGMISLYGIGIVLNHYYGTKLNAAWGIALQVQGIILAVSSNMVKALNPVIMKSEGAGCRERMLDLSFAGCKFGFLLYSFFGIPILFSINVLLPIWLKQVPEWTGVLCSIMILACMIEQLYYVLTQALMAEGNIRNFNIFKSISSILPIVVTIIMFQYGFLPMWVAWNYLIYNMVLGGIICLIFAKINLKMSFLQYFKKTFLRCLIVSFICTSFFLFFHPSTNEVGVVKIVKLLMMFAINIPIYWMIGLNTNERQKVRGIINSAINRHNKYK